MAAVFRKWRFHLSGRSRLLSFCKVAYAIGLQKVAFPSFWALEARVFLQSSTLVFRKWCFHLSGRSRLLSFCKVAHAVGLQKVAFPFFWALEARVFLQSSTLVFRKWCFHLSGRSRLLSFCKVAHAIGLQKVAFPSFWALEAPVFLQSSTCHWSSESGVSIFLDARGSCRSAKVAHAIGLQKMVFPFFWALEAPVVLQSSTCHWSSESGVSIFSGRSKLVVFLQSSTLVFRKWCFHFSGRSRLLPFCESSTCHWSSESGVSIFLGARSSCRSAK